VPSGPPRSGLIKSEYLLKFTNFNESGGGPAAAIVTAAEFDFSRGSPIISI
jgi:hypothetical protein